MIIFKIFFFTEKFKSILSLVQASMLNLFCCFQLCDPMDYSLLGSSIHTILQTRILGWVAMSSSRGSSQPRDSTFFSYVSCIGKQVLFHYNTIWETLFALYKGTKKINLLQTVRDSAKSHTYNHINLTGACII